MKSASQGCNVDWTGEHSSSGGTYKPQVGQRALNFWGARDDSTNQGIWKFGAARNSSTFTWEQYDLEMRIAFEARNVAFRVEQQLNDVQILCFPQSIFRWHKMLKMTKKTKDTFVGGKKMLRIKANYMSQTSTADNSEEVEALKKQILNLKNEFQNNFWLHRGKTKKKRSSKVVENLIELKSNKKMLEDEKRSQDKKWSTNSKQRRRWTGLRALEANHEAHQELELEKVKLEAQLQVLRKSGASTFLFRTRWRRFVDSGEGKGLKSFSEANWLRSKLRPWNETSNSNVEQLRKKQKQNKKVESLLQSRKQDLRSNLTAADRDWSSTKH